MSEVVSRMDKLQELEAQCAAMRQALERIAAGINGLGVDEYGRYVQPREVAQKALSSSDAGRDLLERLRKLEDIATNAKSLLEELTSCAGCWTEPCNEKCQVRENEEAGGLRGPRGRRDWWKSGIRGYGNMYSPAEAEKKR